VLSVILRGPFCRSITIILAVNRVGSCASNAIRGLGSSRMIFNCVSTLFSIYVEQFRMIAGTSAAL
jgi:hypothetical protein